MKFNLSLLAALLCCILQTVSGQEIILSGVILDSTDKQPIPFAHIGIENEMTGTIANENGVFEIHIPSDTKNIVFTAIGYKEEKLKVKKSESALSIYLDLWTNDLAEATVMPKTAREYVEEAVMRLPKNITSVPFSTQSYFSSSNKMENKGLENIKKDEAVFLTYYPNYADTTFKNQNQLLLYRFSDNEVDVDISMIQNKKVKKKMNKLQEKQEKREAKEAQSQTDDQEDPPSFSTNPFGAGKGPDFILSTFQNIPSLSFLDEMFMDKIEFSLGEPSFYGDRELITVKFKNDKPIMLMFTFDGTFYLDSETLAIVSLEYTEYVKIPGLLRPVIKGKTGINITGFENQISIQNQFEGGLWYPQQIVYDSKINLKEGKALKKDEHLYLSSKHILSVEKVIVNASAPIAPELLFDPTKTFEEQVQPIETIEWSTVNVVN